MINLIKFKKIKVRSLIPFIAIIILALIPAYYTRGRLDVGGDVMIFLDTKVLAAKYLYQWVINVPNGQFFSTSYYAIYGLYKFFSFFGLNIYGISFVLLFLLNIIAGLGVWFLTRLFSKDASPWLYIAPIAFYLMSPALLNAWHYNFIYAAIPWFVFLTFRIIKNRNFSTLDVFISTAVILLSSTELPNPKYLFCLSVIFAGAIISSLYFKIISFVDLGKIILKMILVVLISMYLFLPLSYFAKNYSAAAYGVHTQAGYQDDGQMMNYGVDTLDKVLKLHQDQVFINTDDALEYNRNRVVLLLSYSFIFFIMLGMLGYKSLSREEKKLRLVILLLLLIFIFFSAGSNPPLGYFYQAAVSKISLLAFLRTTAGGVFFLSIIYALLLFLFLRDLKQYRVPVAITVIIFTGIVSYPYLNGQYFKNFNNVNKYTDRSVNGFIIPEPYLKVKSILDQKKLDAKVYYPNSTLVYLNTTWGFFGPVIYNFLYQNQNISFDKMYSDLFNHNVGYVLVDNSLMEKQYFDLVKEKTLAMKDDFVDLYDYSRDKFLPHFFTPTQVSMSDGGINSLRGLASNPNYQPRDIVVLKSQNKNKSTADLAVAKINPTIEFKKINIAKYRLIVHNAGSDFPLVFSESFHTDWRLYLKPYTQVDKNQLLSQTKKYQVQINNEDDQATPTELINFVNLGLVSNLGNSPSPDFISKNFADTIQNDNLSSGTVTETWRSAQIAANDHFTVNGYANAWEIKTASICSDKNVCRVNPDGTYDLQILVEFWPQRLVYYGLIIGGCVSGLVLLYTAIKKFKSPKNES